MTSSRIGTWLIAVALATGMLMFGCSDKVPLDPLSSDDAADQPSFMLAKGKDQQKESKSGGEKVRPVKRNKSSAGCTGTVATMKMKPNEGGTLEHCGHRMIIPPGALDKPKTMSIEILNTELIDIEFGPNGQFLKPITVHLSYKDADLTGIEINNLTIVWYDEHKGEWIDIGGVINRAGKYVEAQTDHFTQYTLSVR